MLIACVCVAAVVGLVILAAVYKGKSAPMGGAIIADAGYDEVAFKYGGDTLETPLLSEFAEDIEFVHDKPSEA